MKLLRILLIVAWSLPATQTFPIPANMRETWPGAKLTEAESQSLQKSVNAELYVRETKQESKFTLNTADIPLGTFSNAVIVTPASPILCGTGGCPIYVYAREKSQFRKVLDSFGWAFGVVDSDGKVPDIVVAANLGGGQIGLRLFRFDGTVFRVRACELLTAHANVAPSSWSKVSEVTATACE